MNPIRPYPILLGACAVALITGCAQTGPVAGDAGQGASSQAHFKVEPVYRVAQGRPAGTAAGQYAVGREYLNQGRIDAAILRFQQALQLDPDFTEAHNGLGVAYGKAGRFAEAAEAFRAALAATPGKAHLLSNLGYAQYRAGQLDAAWQSLRASYELEPRNDRTRENLRLVADAMQAGKGDGARAVARPVTQADQPARAAAPQAKAPVAADPERQSAKASATAEPAPQSANNASASLPAATLVIAAQAQAARALGEPPNPLAYQVVVASAPQSQLVQLAPNVYELRGAQAPEQAPAPRAEVVVAPVPVRQALAATPRLPAHPPLRPLGVVSTSRLPAQPLRVSLASSAAARDIDGLEVSNGVGLPRLAGRTAHQLRLQGAQVARVSDYRSFGVTRTQIQYRDGHEAGARALQSQLPVRATLVRSSALIDGINLRLVVGRDMVSGQIAWWTDDTPTDEAALIEPPPAVVSTEAVAALARSEPELERGGWRPL